jgi:hypothetical protein
MIARHYLMKFSCIIVLALGTLCLPDTSHANPSEYYENHQTNSCNSCSSGTCSSTCNSSGDGSCCCCLTSHIENYNGDPTDFGDDYELKVLEENDLQAAVLDPNKSELTIVADTFEKSPWEVYLEELEKSNFKDGTKWLIRTMAESGLSNNFQLTPPARIPRLIQYHHWFPDKTVSVHKDLKNDKRLQFVEKEYLGQFGSQRVKSYRGWYAMLFNIRNTNGEIVGKTCFYRSRWIENRTSESISEKQNNPLELYGCIPNSWLSDLTKKERLHQLRTSKEQNAQLERELIASEIVIGITPFLGVADQVREFYTDPETLTLETGLMCVATGAGDLFLAGKFLNFGMKIAKGATMAAKLNKTEKAVHMATFLTGAGATTVNGYSIFTTAKEDWHKGITWGRAGFFALEVLGMWLDRDAHAMMAPHITRAAAKVKLPQAVQICRSKCIDYNNDVKTRLFDRGFALSLSGSIGKSWVARRLGDMLPSLSSSLKAKIWILAQKFETIYPHIRTRIYSIRRVTEQVVKRAIEGNLRNKVINIQYAAAGAMKRGIASNQAIDDSNLFIYKDNQGSTEIVAWGTGGNANGGPESQEERIRRKLNLIAPQAPELREHVDFLAKHVTWFDDLEPDPAITSDCPKQQEGLNLHSNDWMLLKYHDKQTKDNYPFLYNFSTAEIILSPVPQIVPGDPSYVQ